MEKVLDLHEELYDEKRPEVCFDERPCQRLAEVRQPLRPGVGRSDMDGLLERCDQRRTPRQRGLEALSL
jgi:hypothetical protein